MRLIVADALLKDIEDLKRSPWYLASYISDQRRLGMKEGLDMVSSCCRHAPTVEAIPVEFIESEIKRMDDEINSLMREDREEYLHGESVERMITRKTTLQFILAKWDVKREKE